MVQTRPAKGPVPLNAEGSRRSTEIRDSACAAERIEDCARIAGGTHSERTGECCGGGSESDSRAAERSVEAQRAAAAVSD
jgi:hypothetical protein